MDAFDKLKCLEFMVTRPGMWVYSEKGDNYFEGLGNFLHGIEWASSPEMTSENREDLADLIPSDFTEFVRKQLRCRASNIRWHTIIKLKTKTDREALDLLLELRKKYDLSKRVKKPKKAKDS